MKYFRGGGLSALWEEIKEYLKNYVTIEGNAATATKLKDPVSLWGNPFDGSLPLEGDIVSLGDLTLGAIDPDTGTLSGGNIAAKGNLTLGVPDPNNNNALVGGNINVGGSISSRGSMSVGGTVYSDGVTSTGEIWARGDIDVAGEIYHYGDLDLQASTSYDVMMCGGGGAVYASGGNGDNRAGLNVSNGFIHCGHKVEATAFDTTSDIRKKIKRGEITLSLDAIANAPSILFNWKKDPEGKVRGGSIAQYWQKVAPWAVSEDKDGYLEMDYSALALAASIENAKQIKALRRELGLE